MSVQRGVEVIREDGLQTFLKKSFMYGVNSLKDKLRRQYYLRKGDREISVHNFSSHFPQTDEYDYRVINSFNQHEKLMLSNLLSDLNEGDVVFDIGAHIGFYSCFLPQVASEVIAFEPDPKNISYLQRNLEYNKLSQNVNIIEAAASNEEETVTFGNSSFSRDEWSGKASIAPQPGGDTLTVDTIRVDDLIDEGQVRLPSAVKIDVEGAEGLVLEGMEQTLKSDKCRVVYCEIHKESPIRQSISDYGHSRSNITSILSEAGFEIEILAERGSEEHIRAVKS